MIQITLKLKVLLLGFVSMFIVAIAAFLSFWALNEKLHEYDSLIHQQVQAAITVNETTIEFKKQVQEWKNVLLRGHNRKDLGKYWQKFKQQQEKIQALVDTLLKLEITPESKALVKKFKHEHSAIHEKYVQGYRVYLDNEFGHKEADKYVRGIDRAPTEHLEQATALIIQDAKAKSADLYAASKQVVIFSVIFITIAVVIVSVISHHIGVNHITKPVTNIIKNIRKLADGQFFFKVKVKNRDELGEMANNVKMLQSKWFNCTEEINTSMNVLRQADEALFQLSSDIKSGTESQSLRTDQAASGMTEMSSTSKEVAEHAADAAEASKQAEHAAIEGEKVMVSAINTMHKMQEQIINTSDVIAGLEENTSEIDKVLDVIRAIAEQTNLLALNAAIEAARAGEQGRGFAVVADEVRSLAQRTQDSTAEIHTIIEAVQNSAKNAVQAMDAGRKQSEEGMQRINETGDNLRAIRSAVDKISCINQFIASAALQQSDVAEDMTKSISEIASISYITANQAKDVNQSAQKMKQTRINLEEVIQQLRKE